MTGLWKNWVWAWWSVMMAAALVFWLAAIPGLDAPVLVFYDMIHWPFDGMSGFTEATRPTAAILGAVFLGFALAVGALMRAGLWREATMIIGVWYVTDSAASVLTGVPVNALSNTVIIVAYLIPVLASGVIAFGAPGGSRSA
jgi:hypothetical protein